MGPTFSLTERPILKLRHRKLSCKEKNNLMLKPLLFWAFGYLSYAYIEPGATSFLLKIVISGLVAIVLLFRGAWRMIRLLFSKPASPKQEQGPTDSPEQ